MHNNKTPSPFPELITWFQRERSVRAAVAIGSQLKPSESKGGPDSHSDWDYQILTTDSSLFDSPAWVEAAGLPAPEAYAAAEVVGGVPKVTAIWSDGVEVDLVLLDARQLQVARLLSFFGVHRKSPQLQAALGQLKLIIAPGYRFVVGESEFGGLYRRVDRDVPIPRLSDHRCRQMAASADVSARWIVRMIARGELIAARRALHRDLIETNLTLAHEFLLRQGAVSFPEGRRAESVFPSEIRGFVDIDIGTAPKDLSEAVRISINGTRTLMTRLSEIAD